MFVSHRHAIYLIIIIIILRLSSLYYIYIYNLPFLPKITHQYCPSGQWCHLSIGASAVLHLSAAGPVQADLPGGNVRNQL